MNLFPWTPLYTTFRAGRAETTLYGIVYAGEKSSSIQAGDVDFPLWGRSLLKPWQLMVIYPVLQEAYPALEDRHYALMMASQQSDPQQMEALREIMEAGELSEAHLQCPACGPMKESNRRSAGNVQTPLNHPCSGKHLGYLLYLKARKQALDNYLQAHLEPYQLTRKLFAYLLKKSFLNRPETVDGCGMPNMALSAVDMAKLYRWLAVGLPKDVSEAAPEDELKPILQSWDILTRIMRENPEFVGGQTRLDTRLMQGQWSADPKLSINAKEGAEGLLGLGVGSTSAFPDGVGFLIKLSSGYDPAVLETVAFALLKQLGLCKPLPRKLDREVQVEFHWQLPALESSPLS